MLLCSVGQQAWRCSYLVLKFFTKTKVFVLIKLFLYKKKRVYLRNSTLLFFFEHPWKFGFFFNWSLEFSHAFSSVPLWNIYVLNPLPHCLDFFWNSPISRGIEDERVKIPRFNFKKEVEYPGLQADAFHWIFYCDSSLLFYNR